MHQVAAQPVRVEFSGKAVVLAVWIFVGLLLSILWAFGHYPNGDVDDLLKAAEIRHLLDTGNIFDRIIPGVSQPEPFASHWPWLVDAPYAIVALILSPFGSEHAFQIATFVVPLLLLLPTLALLWKIAEALEFDHPSAVLLVSVFAALRLLAEFQPDRIDYHNLQMLLLAASTYLTLVDGRRNTVLNAVVIALAISIGLELSIFFAIALAVRALDYLRGLPDADTRLRLFGSVLAAIAGLLFLILTRPGTYGTGFCDRYSSPHAVALIGAGLTFAIVPTFIRGAGASIRLAGLAVGALISIALVVHFFPQCLGDPYSNISPYLKQDWLNNISQEKTMFARPDFVLSNIMPYAGLIFVGALAALLPALRQRGRDRRLAILAAYGLVGTLHTVLYFRYFRFLPLFAGPGLALAVGALVQDKWQVWFARKGSTERLAPSLFWGPGLALSAVLVVYHLATPASEPIRSGADMAAACNLGNLETYRWPEGSRVLSPPLIGIMLLGQQNASVVTIPFHTGEKGLERAHRFFDPATVDPKMYADEANATHVAVCGWRGERLTQFSQQYPFAAGLVQGEAPSWLTECPTDANDTLRIYTLNGSCPAKAADN